jgi:predicted transcriptional regulator
MKTKPAFKRHTVKDYEAAIESAGGLQSAIATKLNVSTAAVSQRIKKNKKLQRAMLRQTEKTLDMAEAGLMNALQDEKKWAIQFYLKYKGRSRGYIEKTEVDTNAVKPVPIRFVIAKPPDSIEEAKAVDKGNGKGLKPGDATHIPVKE